MTEKSTFARRVRAAKPRAAKYEVRDEFWCPHIVAIVRQLMLTGCRFGEIAALELDWHYCGRLSRPKDNWCYRVEWG
ncbi:MAG: hypothetical protein OXC01_17900 [Immundisolibacterales bacterium]|nr:hypothetical protein [Immundisolibacterales bacterium]